MSFELSEPGHTFRRSWGVNVVRTLEELDTRIAALEAAVGSTPVLATVDPVDTPRETAAGDIPAGEAEPIQAPRSRRPRRSKSTEEDEVL